MSTLEEITVVVEPETAGGRRNRELHQYDKLAAELRAQSSIPIRIIEDDFSTPPSRGIILLDGYGAIAKRSGWDSTDEHVDLLTRLWSVEQRQRIFCLKLERGREGLEILDRLQLAGGMDSIDYLVAISGQGYGTAYGPSGIYARRTVAESIGCNIEYASDSYCKTTVPPFDSLAQLLTHYLNEYCLALSAA